MAVSLLLTNYKDDVMSPEMGGKRRYRMLANPDGTTTLEDVTKYEQDGDAYGAAILNSQNEAINELIFRQIYGMAKSTTTIAKGDKTTITERGELVTAVTTIAKTSAATTITTTATPKDGDYKYVKTTTISASGGGTTITETYERQGK